jgi:hypothetical protein
MVPGANDGKDDKGDMNQLESLVKGMPQRTNSLDANRNECTDGLSLVSIRSTDTAKNDLQ